VGPLTTRKPAKITGQIAKDLPNYLYLNDVLSHPSSSSDCGAATLNGSRLINRLTPFAVLGSKTKAYIADRQELLDHDPSKRYILS